MNKSQQKTLLHNQWVQLLVVAFIIQTVAGVCVPSNCDDNNPCTADSCVGGVCSNIGICTITNTITPSPSLTPTITNFSGSISKTPHRTLTSSASAAPQLQSITATRSNIPLQASSASPIIAASASSTGGVPSGFPVQSSTATFIPSVSRSASPTRTPSKSITPEPSQTSEPFPTIFPSTTPSATNDPITPSPSSVPASPLPYRLGAPTTVLVQLECGGDCCTNFVVEWAALVSINSEYLMDLLTCDSINSNLVAITYNQFGSNFHDLHQIIGAYWLAGDCGNLNPFQDGPCFPTQGFLYSYDWDNVIEIAVLDGDYISTLTTDYSTDGLTYVTLPVVSSTSDASFLFPSFVLLLCFLLF